MCFLQFPEVICPDKMGFGWSFQLSCLLIIPSVTTIWRETGNKPDSGDREARLKLGKGTMAGGLSPRGKMGCFLAWAGAWVLHPAP